MAGSERVRETDYLPFLILGLEITLFTLLRIKGQPKRTRVSGWQHLTPRCSFCLLGCKVPPSWTSCLILYRYLDGHSSAVFWSRNRGRAEMFWVPWGVYVLRLAQDMALSFPSNKGHPPGNVSTGPQPRQWMKCEEDWMHLQKPKPRAAGLCLDQCSLCFDQGEAGRLGPLVPVAECHPSNNPALPCRFLGPFVL